MAITCYNCQAANQVETKFCTNCGASLQPPPLESWRINDEVNDATRVVTETREPAEADDASAFQPYQPPTYQPPVPVAPQSFEPAYPLPPAAHNQPDTPTRIGYGLSIAAMCLMVVGLIPCLGWLNWLTLPLSLVALALAVISLINKGSASLHPRTRVTLILSIIALVIGWFRLSLGAGCL